jgi:hypothetical protein
MKRILLALALGAIAVTCALTGTAAASGPAPPGREIVEVECEGLGTITVAVPRNEHGEGAGQIVGEKGHGILVSSSFTLTDLTTGETVFSGSEAKGGGNSHPHQSTVACKGAPEEVEAALFFGEEELPEGVEPTDILLVEFEANVIVKR